MYPGSGYRALHPMVVVLCIREHPNRGLQRECKRFGRDAILWLVSGEVASPAMEKTDEGEERSVAPLWVALLSMPSLVKSGEFYSVQFRPPPSVGSNLPL
jgi:hypothetical protein